MNDLERARDSFERRMWMDAFNAFSLADDAVPLGAEDLWPLAVSAFLIGREDDYVRTMDRAYRAAMETGEPLIAARAAFWLGLHLADRAEMVTCGFGLRQAGGSTDRRLPGATC